MEKAILHNKSSINGTIFFRKKDLASLIIGLIAFFLGNVSVLGFFNPIVFAYLLNFICTGTNFYYVFFFSAVGLLLTFKGMFFAKYFLLLCAIFFLNIYLYKVYSKPTTIIKAIFGSITVFIGGVLVAVFDSMSIYFFLVAAVEGVLTFTLTITLERATTIISKNRRKRVLSNEEIISIGILFSGLLVGSTNTFLGSNFITYTLLTFIILITANKGGSSVACMTAFIATISLITFGYNNFFIIPILCIGAICAGFLRERGKHIVIIGFFVAVCVCSLYFDFTLISLQSLLAILIGSGAFYLMRDDFYFNVYNLVSPQIDSSEEYIDRVKEILDFKLNAFSNSFYKLSKTFDNLSEKKTSLTQQDIAKLIDDIVSKACGDCEMVDKCWKENFYDTYKIVFEIIGNCEKSNNGSKGEISSKFLEVCVNPINFATVTNRLYEVYKSNLTWHNKIVESRELVSDQLMGVSKIINDLANDLDLYIDFKEELEESLILELNKNKIEVDSVIVLENKLGKYEVTINKKLCMDRRQCKSEIIPIISQVLGRKMKNDLKDCSYRGENCKIRLVEEQKLRITSGIAKAKKSGSSESGDSYSFLELKNGQCLLALSDGMGSGKKARQESVATVELLEDFIESGFDKELAVKMINSVLVLKSSEDSFSTLDICSINMYNGDAEFIKIGASVTFLLRDRKVQTIKASSLPIGILNTVDLEVCTKKLMNDDIIIMVTDGMGDVVDAYGDREKWIIEELEKLKSSNPQEIANHLLDKAESMLGGVFHDDMTILVAKLWERP